jgi:hypothetical protein
VPTGHLSLLSGAVQAVKITVLRDIFTDQSVTSEVLLDGEQRWFGIEPPNRPQKPCCIPSGNYKLILGDSVHFSMTVPMVQNIEGFTGIEIHPGNFPRDTHGCLCIGEGRGPDDVTQSRIAFDQLMAELLKDPDDLTITYVGGMTL